MERAYTIWEQEGRPEGRDLAHWLQAEAGIKMEEAFGPIAREKILGETA
jgi:hypothetical protein